MTIAEMPVPKTANTRMDPILAKKLPWRWKETEAQADSLALSTCSTYPLEKRALDSDVIFYCSQDLHKEVYIWCVGLHSIPPNQWIAIKKKNCICKNLAGKLVTCMWVHFVLQTSGYHSISWAWAANQSMRKWIFTYLIHVYTLT